MRITTSINPDSRIPTHGVIGELTVELVRRAIRKLIEHPEFKGDRNSLWDMRRAEGLTGPEDVWARVEMVLREEGEAGRGITAFLLQPELFFSVGEPRERIYQGVRQRARVFDDPHKAAEWLENHEHRRDSR